MESYFRVEFENNKRGWILQDGDHVEVRSDPGFYADHGQVFDYDESSPFDDYVKTKFKRVKRFVRSPFEPATVLSRIWRPNADPPMKLLMPREWASASQPVRILAERLMVLFQYVEPTPENNLAYGHQARDLIILAATEVEASLRALIRIHRADLWNERMTMGHYVHLEELLHLTGWTVELSLFPGFGKISPFLGWDRNRPTQSLPWYAAYNAVKHDRDQAFPQATMSTAVHAVAASLVLLAAQFGLEPIRHDRSLSVFTIDALPTWSLEEDYPPPWLMKENSDIRYDLVNEGAQLDDFAARWKLKAP